MNKKIVSELLGYDYNHIYVNVEPSQQTRQMERSTIRMKLMYHLMVVLLFGFFLAHERPVD